MNSLLNRTFRNRKGFTLIEVLVAAVISAILILSLNTLLYNALHLRDDAVAEMVSLSTEQNVLNLLRQDLRSAVSSDTALAGRMLGISSRTSMQMADSLEFHTASGRISEYEPWGDIQKVQYSLMELENPLAEKGLYLIRAVTRNLLAPIQETPMIYPLLPHVHSLMFQYFDGEVWLDSWDSELQETPVPKAVRVQILLFKNAETNANSSLPVNPTNPYLRTAQPDTLELLVPLVMQPETGEDSTENSTTGSSQESEGER
jgi:type II secretion system protein J